jgi:hypothetical protein
MPYVWLLVDTYEEKEKEKGAFIFNYYYFFKNKRAQDDLYDFEQM